MEKVPVKSGHLAGSTRSEKFHVNAVEIEGIVTKVWYRSNDIFLRLATYDEFSEVLVPAGNGALPRRQAHYATLQLVNGKTLDGAAVSANAKDHVRATGFLRDAAYSESLATFLRKAKRFDRILDRDDELSVGRVATYVVVRTLIRFG